MHWDGRVEPTTISQLYDDADVLDPSGKMRNKLIDIIVSMKDGYKNVMGKDVKSEYFSINGQRLGNNQVTSEFSFGGGIIWFYIEDQDVEQR